MRYLQSLICHAVLVLGVTGSPALVFAQQDPWLIDMAASSGLDFTHFNGMSGELYFIEMMGAGVALLDYDLDGDLDVYIGQGHMLGKGKTIADATFPPRHAARSGDRLYRNETTSVDGEVVLRFTDVTESAGIVAPGYNMGVAVGDIDNDGYPDLYVMNYRDNMLWRNRGDGTFEDITAKSGTNDTRWSVSASFFDYDRDGLLDLFVGNYLRHDIDVAKVCRMSKRVRDYCGPTYGDGEADALFRNLGGGRFENVSADAGIDELVGGALGVIAADFNGDDWLDIYVANDGMANRLWVNQRNGKFVDEGLLSGVAVNRDGMPEGSMGVDAQDFDDDGDLDIFITHFDQETNTLYVNDGTGWFEDESVASGLGNPSFRYTAFGTAWFDLDNDGLLDIFSVNGAVKKKPELVLAGDTYPLHEHNQLFMRNADGTYRDVTSQAGPALAASYVSRGTAFGDIDNDGDADIIVVNNAGPAELLLNQLGQRNGWLGLDLRTSGRPAHGAVATLQRKGQATLTRRVRVDGSYASANDPRILFGLGPTRDEMLDVDILWPDGKRERFVRLAPGQYHTLQQGSGQTPGKSK